ncbi:serpin family protein [bacterium]|nr:serpin family protein [bacterium]
MKKIITMFLILSLLIIVVQCSRTSPNAPESVRDLGSLEKSMVESSNAFGFDIFSRMAAIRPDSNLFISPLSISMALGMATNGASGTTADAMRTVLGYDGMTMAEINQTYKSLIDLLTSLDENVIMEIANSLWGREGFPIQADFIQTLQTYFEAEARTLNFSEPGAVDIINGWIEDKTHGKIKNMLSNISPQTVLFLINAIYFKADWTTAFDPEDTYDGYFNLANGSNVECKLMKQKDEFAFAETDKVKIIDLPYEDGHYSMTVIQPRGNLTITDILADFNESSWKNWLNMLTKTKLDLSMPRFKVEDNWKLNDILTAMGMGIAFGDNADFSNINPEADLFISKVLHRSFVDVNEQGTEAAAATVVEISFTAAGPFMNLNSPFIYIIRDHNTDTMMFIGILYNPAESK